MKVGALDVFGKRVLRIEADALTRIFEAFSQTREGAAAGGTGLGLAISRHLIQTMGDELKVESTPRQGSRFYFALPLVRPSDDWIAADEPEDTTEPSLDARLAPGQGIAHGVAVLGQRGDRRDGDEGGVGWL